MNQEQTDPYITETVIVHSYFREIQEIIHQRHLMAKTYGEPRYSILEGPGRTGKTWLARAYANRFPPERTEEGQKMPVLYLQMPALATTEKLLRKMLDALEYSHAYTESKVALDAQLIKLLRVWQVELIILDQFNYLVRQASVRIMYEILDSLLALAEETRISILAVTAEGNSEDLGTHQKFAVMFTKPLILPRFPWDESDAATLHEFAQVMRTAEQIVGLKSSVQDSEDLDLLCRIHYATDGSIGHLMNLLREAAHIAGKQGKDALNFQILAKAFDQACPLSLATKVNPFISSRGKIFTPPEKRVTNSKIVTKEKRYPDRKPARRPVGMVLSESTVSKSQEVDSN